MKIRINPHKNIIDEDTVLIIHEIEIESDTMSPSQVKDMIIEMKKDIDSEHSAY